MTQFRSRNVVCTTHDQERWEKQDTVQDFKPLEES